MTAWQLCWGLILKDLIYAGIGVILLLLFGLCAFIYCVIRSCIREKDDGK